MLKPRSTPTRELVNLDGVWRFALDSRVGDAPWERMLETPLEAAVPASYNDLFTDPQIRDHVGWVYYQRTVRVPRGWTEDHILLRFDAATHAARVYVDDTPAGEHVGGPDHAGLAGDQAWTLGRVGQNRPRRVMPVEQQLQHQFDSRTVNFAG